MPRGVLFLDNQAKKMTKYDDHDYLDKEGAMSYARSSLVIFFLTFTL